MAEQPNVVCLANFPESSCRPAGSLTHQSRLRTSLAGLEVSMFSSFAFAVTICVVAGTIIVVALAARAGADGSIARVLYNTEHPKKSR
jgi:hypothetical protein